MHAWGFCVYGENHMKMHLYEFKSDKKKLKCLCGWERTLKTADTRAAYEKFQEHCTEQARVAAN